MDVTVDDGRMLDWRRPADEVVDEFTFSGVVNGLMILLEVMYAGRPGRSWIDVVVLDD